MHGSFTDAQRLSATNAARDHASGEAVVDADLLFNGEFKRAGDGLKIAGPDGRAVFIPDYFKDERLATLYAPDGSSLSGDTVAALAHAGLTQGFTYLSTAGGAFLEWLEGKTLPGIAALMKHAPSASRKKETA